MKNHSGLLWNVVIIIAIFCKNVSECYFCVLVAFSKKIVLKLHSLCTNFKRNLFKNPFQLVLREIWIVFWKSMYSIQMLRIFILLCASKCRNPIWKTLNVMHCQFKLDIVWNAFERKTCTHAFKFVTVIIRN